MQQSRRVVVGFDGTDPSGRALDWASDEAVRRGIPLTVLSASEPVDVVPRHSEGSAWMPADALPAAQALTAAGEARARARQPHVVLHVRPTVGRPADALVVASWSAALVVVGTRGHGEVVGDLLGSVATALVTRGRGQVVVVRGDGDSFPGPDHPVVVGVDGTPGAALAADARPGSQRRPVRSSSW